MSDIDIKNSTADASIEPKTAKDLSLTSEKTPAANKSKLIEEVREAKETFKEPLPEAAAQKPDGQAVTQELNDLSQKITQSTLTETSPSTEQAVELASNIDENILTTPEKLIDLPQSLSAEIEELLK